MGMGITGAIEADDNLRFSGAADAGSGSDFRPLGVDTNGKFDSAEMLGLPIYLDESNGFLGRFDVRSSD